MRSVDVFEGQNWQDLVADEKLEQSKYGEGSICGQSRYQGWHGWLGGWVAHGGVSLSWPQRPCFVACSTQAFRRLSAPLQIVSDLHIARTSRLEGIGIDLYDFCGLGQSLPEFRMWNVKILHEIFMALLCLWREKWFPAIRMPRRVLRPVRIELLRGVECAWQSFISGYFTLVSLKCLFGDVWGVLSDMLLHSCGIFWNHSWDFLGILLYQDEGMYGMW